MFLPKDGDLGIPEPQRKRYYCWWASWADRETKKNGGEMGNPAPINGLLNKWGKTGVK